MRSFSNSLLAGTAAFLLLCPSVFSQANLGTIRGTVTDRSGAVVVGAVVTVTDTQRGIARSLVSDAAGEYIAPNLLPGKYVVRGQGAGFKTLERSNILLEVGNDIRIDIPLEFGERTESIEVTSGAPAVNTTNSTLGGTISNKTINELPLNGRNYQNLLTLRPGVSIYPGGGAWSQSTNGMRPEDNTYIVDGLTNDNPFNAFSVVNGPAIVGDAVTVIPIDAIQEFSTQISPGAQYGWKPGVVVNVQLKSGTNELHGTAFAFGRSDAFDALNYFSSTPQALTLQQFGATAGGPVLKDKMFWFAAYEGQRYSIGTALPITIPSAAAGGGSGSSIPDAKAELAKYGVPVSALSLQLLPLFTNNTTGIVDFPDQNSSDNYLGKLDYQVNDHHTLNGTFFFAKDTLTGQDAAYLQPQWSTSNPQEPITAGGSWNWSPNSRWTNVARLGYVYDDKYSFSNDNETPATAYGINTGVTDPLLYGMPQISVSGFTALGGSSGEPKFQGPAVVWQGIDNVYYLHGKHAFAFGVELRHNSVKEGGYQGGKGQVSFGTGNAFDISATATDPEIKSTSLEDFLAGVPRNGKIAVGDPIRNITTWYYAGFFQDDWHLKPGLTLNLGLRYEHVTPIRDSDNLLGNFDPQIGLVQVGKQIASPYNGDHKDFSPRIGIVWDPWGDSKTVVRAGGSLMYSTPAMETFLNQGATQNANTLGLGNIPTGAAIVQNGVTMPGSGTINATSVTVPGGPGSTLASNWQNNSPSTPLFDANSSQCGDGVGSDPSPCSVLAVDRNLRTPYVTMWNIGIQQVFKNNITLEIDYAGNRGSRWIGMRDINQGAPIPGSATAAAGPYTVKFPYLAFINTLSNLYSSNYNGLQATLTVRPVHGLSMLAGYTFSHSLDYSSTTFNQYLPQDSMNPNLEYASSDYDMRHRFTLSSTYSFAGKPTPGQLLEGWEINSLVTLESGQPWNTNDTVDNISGTNENSDRWDFVGNPADFTSGPHSIPYCTGPNNCAEVVSGGRGQQTLQLPNSAALYNACSTAAGSAGALDSLASFGCYAQGHSVMIPPAIGTFGTMRRNMFRDSGFKDWDLSVAKNWKLESHFIAQFRVEFFNVLNHPSFANPYGGANAYGAGAFDDPSSTSQFGCGCATPDQAAGDPLLASGGNRAMQLGFKLIF
jgi:Carboxypeptidase regulatory-like domain/TonB dependent receptor